MTSLVKKAISRSLLTLIYGGILLLNFSCQSQEKEKVKEPYPHTNHLIDQTSPYLLQHAHNPVEWYPWGEEALNKAKKENKLLLISVGYAACHWCHVMEHESFENEEVARLMNANFVCIKVDREERQDIDQIYMSAVQLMTGSGGWPLNCFALPDGKPFYGGTYFKREQWMDLLNRISNEYTTNPEKVREYAENLTNGVKQSEMIIKNTDDFGFKIETLDEMVGKWQSQFDMQEGGTHRAPKFPLPNNLQFLLRYGALGNHTKVDAHVELTLNKMAFGGLYDQIGGGFTRYSTDKYWKVPHFEKMLYDNGQLISLYSEAYMRFRNPLYREVVFASIAFCQRELSNGNGVFYSSLDADSDGEEGKYYVWTEEEFKSVVGADYDVLKRYYNLGKKALWEHGNNIPLREVTDVTLAAQLGISENTLKEAVARANKRLLRHREERIHPGLDDKSLTSWNAIMMKGLIDAYVTFGEVDFLNLARKTGKFIAETQRKKDGGLLHNYKNGTSNINGFLEDYSLTIEAFVRMYEATFDVYWLEEARKLSEYSIAHFYDIESGMFCFTSDLDPALIARKMEVNDNVIPSSNASMANGLFLVGTIYDDHKMLKLSETMLNNVQEQMTSYGSGYSHWGNLMLKQVYPLYEVAVVGNDALQKRSMLEDTYIPNKLVLGSLEISKIPLLEGKYIAEETLYYVCVNKACQIPTSNVEEALKQMK